MRVLETRHAGPNPAPAAYVGSTKYVIIEPCHTLTETDKENINGIGQGGEEVVA